MFSVLVLCLRGKDEINNANMLFKVVGASFSMEAWLSMEQLVLRRTTVSPVSGTVFGSILTRTHFFWSTSYCPFQVHWIGLLVSGNILFYYISPVLCNKSYNTYVVGSGEMTEQSHMSPCKHFSVRQSLMSDYVTAPIYPLCPLQEADKILPVDMWIIELGERSLVLGPVDLDHIAFLGQWNVNRSNMCQLTNIKYLKVFMQFFSYPFPLPQNKVLNRIWISLDWMPNKNIFVFVGMFVAWHT